MQSTAQIRLYAWLVLLGISVSVSASKNHYQLDDFTTLDFEELKGSWVVISYWAIWCPPCKDEIKILNGIYEERQKFNVTILGVNFDGVQGVKLRDQKKRFGAKYPDLLSDPGERWGLTKPTFIPRTLIINQEGELHKVFDGITSRREVLKSLEA